MPFYNRQTIVEKAVTVQIASAYDANDVVGGLLTFSVSNPGGGGSIRSVTIVDADDEKAAYNLYWFETAPSSFADGDTFAPTLADLKKLVGITGVGSSDYTTYGAYARARRGNLDIDWNTTDGNLYLYMACVATPTYTVATDLTVYLYTYLDG